MTTENGKTKALTFSSRAQYQLHVLGHIDQIWSEYLAGLTIVSVYSQDDQTITMLEGTVGDQAELLGVLNSIYEMHLPLISVSFVELQ